MPNSLIMQIAAQCSRYTLEESNVLYGHPVPCHKSACAYVRCHLISLCRRCLCHRRRRRRVGERRKRSSLARELIDHQVPKSQIFRAKSACKSENGRLKGYAGSGICSDGETRKVTVMSWDANYCHMHTMLCSAM